MTSNCQGGNHEYSSSPVGRPRSLPPEALERVLLHHQAGLSYGDIVRELRNIGFDVSRWTVRRAVLSLSPYQRLGS